MPPAVAQAPSVTFLCDRNLLTGPSFCITVTSMTTKENEKNKGGRPATGVTPVRTVRIGDEWDEAERLAGELAEHMGFPKASLPAYVRQALVMENARVTKFLAKSRAARRRIHAGLGIECEPCGGPCLIDVDAACAAHDDDHLGKPCPDREILSGKRIER